MNQDISEEHLAAMDGVLLEMEQLSAVEKTRLLAMVSMLLPAVRDTNVGALIATVSPAHGGYVGLGLATYNMNDAQAVSTLDAAASMVQRNADEHISNAARVVQ